MVSQPEIKDRREEYAFHDDIVYLHEAKRGLTRATIEEIVPQAEEGLSYGVPVFRVGTEAIAGFAAFKRHLSYLPHSGSVLTSLDPALLEWYTWSKGALRFPVDTPLPRSLVEALIEARAAEITG